MTNITEDVVSHEDQFISNLLVDTLNDRFESQRFAVEFAFLPETTVDTVFGDLEEALVGMGLQLAIPRSQCALAYDRSKNGSTDMGGTNDGCANGGTCSVDDENVTVLSGTDCIFKAPPVGAFYDLNRRCGLNRVATFLVVKKPIDPLLSQKGSQLAREPKSFTRDDKRLNSEMPARVVGGVGGGGLSAYLLQRQSQFDEPSNALLTFAANGSNRDKEDRGSVEYQSALARVRDMVATEERLILASRGQQQHPPREPHWSLQMNQPPSRLEWLKALEMEAAAYDRLNARIAHASSVEVSRQEAARDVLEKEVSQLLERIDGVKISVTKRQALQERIDRLKSEMEAQREKEHDLLQELEKVKTREMKQQPPPPLGVPPSFRLHTEHQVPLPGQPFPFAAASPSTQQDGRFSSQHRTPLNLEHGLNYSAIHASTGETGAQGASNFLSPSVREEVRHALSSNRTSPMGVLQSPHYYQQQGQQQQPEQPPKDQPKQTDLRKLRQLAVELGQHLRSPNPNSVERRRLMNEIHALRQQVEQHEANRSRAAVSSF